MYRVYKAVGASANIIIENTDTKANINIGKITSDIRALLTETPDFRDEWNIEVNKETAEALAKQALSMSKPIRDQSKKAKDLFKKPNNEIDAMDVLLGLASYN